MATWETGRPVPTFLKKGDTLQGLVATMRELGIVRYKDGPIEIVLSPATVDNARRQPHPEFSSGPSPESGRTQQVEKRRYYEKLLARSVSDEELSRLPD